MRAIADVERSVVRGEWRSDEARTTRGLEGVSLPTIS